MSRQRIRKTLEYINRHGMNPLYPDIPDSQTRQSTPVPNDSNAWPDPVTPSQTRVTPRKTHRGLRLNWKDAIIFSLLILIGGIYQVRAQEMLNDPWGGISAGVVLFGQEPGKTATQQMTLVASRIETDAVGIVANSRMTQIFRNNSEQTVDEAVYAFGLPDGAAVFHMRLRIGQRLIESEIHEKRQARTIYDNARQAGQKASLLQQHRPNLFTTRISQVAPGETVQVEIFWQQPLNYDNGVFELRLPLALKPRFAPETTTPDTPEAIDPQPAQPVFDQQQRQVLVRLEAGFPLARLESLYHPINRQDHGPVSEIHFADKQLADANDFVLRWQPAAGKTVQAVVFQEIQDGMMHQLLMLMPPLPDTANDTPIQPREVVFVVDTSGSMWGTAMDQARDALLFGLQQLNPGDRFNIIAFSDTADALFHHSRPIDAATFNLALTFIDSLHAEGGTNMQPALAQALTTTTDNRYLKQVVFITDGAVDNEAQLFRYINQQLGPARLFTIGIGGAPNSHFMRKAAQFGRGTYTHIAKLDEVDERLSELFRKISAPVLTGITLDIDPESAQQNPSIIPDLYQGEPVFITLRGQSLSQNLTLFGENEHRLWQKDLTIRPHQSPGIARLWARQRLEELLDQRQLGLADADWLAETITRLALRYHLVSPFTSLVAVDKTPQPSARHKKTVAREALASAPFPQTALGWQWRMLTGMLLLLAAAFARHALNHRGQKT